MTMRSKARVAFLLVVFAEQLHADWRTTVMQYWNEYQDWFRTHAGALYLNVEKPALLMAPWKAGVSGGFSMGYVPPIPRKYKVIKSVFPVSIYASCGGIGFNINIDDWIDFDALKNWLMNYVSNVLFNYLIAMIYSNNTIANVLATINRVNNRGLTFQASKCTRQWMDFAQTDEFKRLSATEKLCVSMLYTSGQASMKEALDQCANQADRIVTGQVIPGLPSFTKELEPKSCYDISDLTPDEKDFFELLFGWFENVRDVARDSSGNPYWGSGADKEGYIIRWHAPEPDSTSLVIIDSTFRRRTYDAFMGLMRILGDTSFVGGSAAAEMDSIVALVNKIVLPGSYLSLPLLNDMAHLDPVVQAMAGRSIAALSGIYAIQTLLDRAWQLYYRCKGDNTDKRIPEDQLENFRELITFYEGQLQNMMEEANIHETALKNPMEFFAKTMAARKSVAVSKVFVDVGQTTELRDMPTYGGSSQIVTHTP